MKHLLRSLIPGILTLTLFAFLLPLGAQAAPLAPQQAQSVAAANRMSAASASPTIGGAWTPLGPEPLNTAACSTCLHYGLNSGRVTALAVNPSNSSDVWLGSDGGGVWHSTDGGAHWTPMTDTQPTLSIGSIAIDPHNPNTVYVGTGSADIRNGAAQLGAGVLKTTDGGAHWTQLGFSDFGGQGIARIAVDPNNSNNVLAALSFGGFVPGGGNGSTPGIWQSTDGGATWTEVLADAPTPPFSNRDLGDDVVFDPAHPGVVFAGLGNINGNPTPPSIAGVSKSTNSGATWSLLTGTIPSGMLVGHVSLGISNDGQHIYAVLGDGGGDLLNSAIYVSTDNGVSWAAKDVSGVPEMVQDDAFNNWFNSYVAVDPTDSTGNTAYVVSEDIWQTKDGGATWTNLTNAFNLSGEGTFAGVAPGQYALVFLSSTSSSFYVGNTGGVWSGTNAGAFTNLNGGGLDITEFYRGSIGEVGPDAQLYGAGQINEDQFPAGTPQTGPAQWNEVFGHNFGSFAVDTVVDYANNANVYEVDPYHGVINISKDGGATWNPAPPLPNNQGLSFILPLIISPNNHNELLTGEAQVFLTSDGGATWNPISPILDSTCTNGCGITALAIAPGNDNVIYATDSVNLYVTTNKGGSWTTRAIPGQFYGLAVDPTNPSVVYATVPDGPLSSTGLHIFKSTNSGASWTDISTSLPTGPFTSVVVNPANHNMVLAGSYAGAFISTNGGACWSTLGTGLPNVAINQVFLNQTGTRIFAATFGRGMWTLPMPQPPILGACPAQIPPTSPRHPGRGSAGPPSTPHVARLTTADNSPQ